MSKLIDWLFTIWFYIDRGITWVAERFDRWLS